MKLGIAPFIIFICILGGLTTLFTLSYYANQRAERLHLFLDNARKFETVLHHSLRENFKNLKLAMDMFLVNEAIIETFAARDRANLLQQTQMLYEETLKPQYGIKQMQFHLPPATSFLRVNYPNAFGDDLSNFRKTVLYANTEKRPIFGLEAGKAGPGLRVVYPIFHHQQHIGSLELGSAIETLLNSVQDLINIEYGLAVKKSALMNQLNYYPQMQPNIEYNDFLYYQFSSDETHKILAEPSIQESDGNIIFTENHTFFIKPLLIKDFSDEPVIRVLLLKDMQKPLNELWDSSVTNAFVFFIIASFIGLIAFANLQRLRNRFEQIIHSRTRELQEKTAAYDAISAKFHDFQQSKLGYVATLTYTLKNPLQAYQGHLEACKSYADEILTAHNALETHDLHTQLHKITQETRDLMYLVDDIHEIEMIRMNLFPAEDILISVDKVEFVLKHLIETKNLINLQNTVSRRSQLIKINPARLETLLTKLINFLVENSTATSPNINIKLHQDRLDSVALTFTAQVKPVAIQDLQKDLLLKDSAYQFLEQLKVFPNLNNALMSLCVAKFISQHYGGELTFKKLAEETLSLTVCLPYYQQ